MSPTQGTPPGLTPKDPTPLTTRSLFDTTADDTPRIDTLARTTQKTGARGTRSADQARRGNVPNANDIATVLERNFSSAEVHADTPAYLQEAERELTIAMRGLRMAKGRNAPDLSQELNRFRQATANYNVEAAHFIHQSTKSGREDVNLSESRFLKTPGISAIRVNGANVHAALASNLAYSIPAGVAVAANHVMVEQGVAPSEANKISEYIFAAGVASLGSVMDTSAGRVKNQNGGTNPTFMMGREGHAKTGPYTEHMGNLLNALMSTVIYASARGVMTEAASEFSEQIPDMDNLAQDLAVGVGRGAAAAGVAALSAVMTAGIREGVLNYAAQKTQEAAEVEDGAHMPIPSHNRTHPVGVRLNNVKNPDASLDGYMGNTKSRARTTDRVAMALAAGPMLAVNLSMADAAGTAGPQTSKVIAAFTALFVMREAVKAAGTKMFAHPKAHPGIQGKSGVEGLIRDIKASSLTPYQNALKGVARSLTQSASGTAEERNFSNTHKVFDISLGVVPPDYEGYTDFLTNLATDIRHDAGDVPTGEVETDRHRLLGEIASRLDKAAGAVSEFAQLRKQNTGSADFSPFASTSFGTIKSSDSSDSDFPSSADPCCTAPAGDHKIPPYILLNEARNALFDAQALVIEAEYKTSDSAGTSPSLDGLLPVFAGLEATETKGKATEILDQVRVLSVKKTPDGAPGAVMRQQNAKAAQTVMAQLNNNSTINILPSDLIDLQMARPRMDMQKHRKIMSENFGKVSEMAKHIEPAARRGRFESLKTSAQSTAAKLGNKYPIADAKIMILQNMLRGTIAPNQAVNLALANLASEHANRDHEPQHNVKELGKSVVAALKDGSVSAEQVADELQRLKRNFDAPVFQGIRKSVGAEVVDTLLGNFPATDLAVPEGIFGKMDESIAKMDGDLRRLWSDAGKLNPIMKRAPVEPIQQKDAHYHPTNYNGVINSLSMLLRSMEANDIIGSNAAGIPSQITHTKPELQYYLAVQKKPKSLGELVAKTALGLTPDEATALRYRSHDQDLAADLERMAKDGSQDANKIVLSITGLDVTDGRAIAQELDQRMTANPGQFRSVGEVTLIKEVVSGLNEEIPIISSPATTDLLENCRERGLPVLIHCDRGSAQDKHQHAEEFEAVLENWAMSLKNDDDTMEAIGDMAEIPRSRTREGAPALGKVCWAHGAGLARFTPDAADHAQKLDSLLNKDVLKPHLYVDLSWDFTAQNILQNVGDVLNTQAKQETNPTVAQDLKKIAKHLDALVKSYRAFASAGGTSDEAQNIGDFLQSAMFRSAASEAATLHLNQLSDFKGVVRDTIAQNPDVGTALEGIMTREDHSATENNWLKMFADHSDRLMFGTDALAIGTKAHGEAAYAVNTKILHPVYYIFHALAEAVENGELELDSLVNRSDLEAAQAGQKLRKVVSDIARDTFTDFFEDPEMGEVREAYERGLQQHPSDHTADLPRARTIDLEAEAQEVAAERLQAAAAAPTTASPSGATSLAANTETAAMPLRSAARAMPAIDEARQPLPSDEDDSDVSVTGPSAPPPASPQAETADDQLGSVEETETERRRMEKVIEQLAEATRPLS